MEHSRLSKEYKSCAICRRSLPLDYEPDLCPICSENELFNKVKEFIRSHDVTEYQVAEEFDIPLRTVRRWIKEGRIEYKDVDVKKVLEMHCISCGAPIKFGSYCQKCFKLMNTTKATYIGGKEEERMRFLE